MTLSRNLETQINITENVEMLGSTEGSCDQQAFETDMNSANTHSRTANTEKLSALTAENTKLKAQVTGKTCSGPSTSETPKVLAPGMYDLGSKYVPPPKRANWAKPTPLPKKKQVTFSEPPKPSLKSPQKPVVHPNKQTNVCVPLSTGVKPTSGASKTVPKRVPQNHSTLPAKSANARRVEAHHRTLNKKNRVDSNLLVKHSVSVSRKNNVCGACNNSLVFGNHNDCLVICADSVNVKPHQTKRRKHQPKKEWKPIKRVWKPISKPVANSKPQWKPTGRHFSLFEKYPLTRIMEPTDMPLELPPSASSSPQITMVSRFIDHKLSDRKAGSKGISGSTNCSMQLVGYGDYNWRPLSSLESIIFLRTKDETPQVIEKFIVKTQRALNATVRFVRTDNGTEFVNKTLDGWFESVGISHETSVPRSPQQNGVVERRNRTLMEAARTMLIFAKAPLFLWAKAVATAYFRVFGSLCYPTNDYDDVGKLKAKADIGLAPQQMTSVPNSTELELTALQSGRSRSATWLFPIPPVVPITPVNVPAAPTQTQNAMVHLPQAVISEAVLQLRKPLTNIKVPLPVHNLTTWSWYPEVTPALTKSFLQMLTMQDVMTHGEYICSGLMSCIDLLAGHTKKQKIEREVACVVLVETKYQLADIFTKALPRERLATLLPLLGVKQMSPETLKELQDESVSE
ncbi:integrase, catalytic region, zinc finger, CCHC-type containing protein [Tanacetum coccineum]|uniref:Integrase, catalytic region, zinc finger, CCHC-type containing protein n=1 Tax=Tanacetum coccineum TaxID=301880 RepID=A0ABQ5BHN8_9ASTR